MRSVRKRLASLEARTQEPADISGWRERNEWLNTYYFPLIENVRLEKLGLEPLPVPEDEDEVEDPELDARIEEYLEALEEETHGISA